MGSFPDGNSALMLVCARLRHVAGTLVGQQKAHEYNAPEAAAEDGSIAGSLYLCQNCKPKCEKLLTLPISLGSVKEFSQKGLQTLM